MPQLQLNEMMVGQIVWLFLIFGALYYILSTYALPRVAVVLEDRKHISKKADLLPHADRFHRYQGNARAH